jgi:hypothetical protein
MSAPYLLRLHLGGLERYICAAFDKMLSRDCGSKPHSVYAKYHQGRRKGTNRLHGGEFNNPGMNSNQRNGCIHK